MLAVPRSRPRSPATLACSTTLRGCRPSTSCASQCKGVGRAVGHECGLLAVGWSVVGGGSEGGEQQQPVACNNHALRSRPGLAPGLAPAHWLLHSQPRARVVKSTGSEAHHELALSAPAARTLGSGRRGFGRPAADAGHGGELVRGDAAGQRVVAVSRPWPPAISDAALPCPRAARSAPTCRRCWWSCPRPPTCSPSSWVGAMFVCRAGACCAHVLSWHHRPYPSVAERCAQPRSPLRSSPPAPLQGWACSRTACRPTPRSSCPATPPRRR